MDDYNETKNFFNSNATNYSNSDSHKNDSDLEILMNSMELSGDMIGLDIATGSGFTAIKMATYIKKVYALDFAENMLRETRKLANENGMDNIEVVKAPVEELPYTDNFFDVVTCRRAAHHFMDKEKFLKESYRVLKNNGMIGIDDMTASDDNVENLNRLERLRDHTHMYAESPERWAQLLKDQGFRDIKYKIYEKRLNFLEWVYPVAENSPEGIESYNFLKKADSTFLSYIDFKNNSFIKRWVVVTARK